MAKRKEKGKSTGKIHQPKGSTQVTNQQPANKFIPLLVIGIAAVALIVYWAMSSSSTSQQDVAQTGQNGTTNTSLASPMTGTEDFSAGQIDTAKATVTTFKMEELGGTDCVRTIMTELVKLGGIGNLKADYSNKLLEIQYEPAKVTVAKLIDALIKGQHPGQVTTEKIAKKKSPVYVGGSIVEESTDSTESTGSSANGAGGNK